MNIINIIFFIGSILELVAGIKLFKTSLKKPKDILITAIGTFFIIVSIILLFLTLYIIIK